MQDFKSTIEETLEFYREEEKRLAALIASLPKGIIKKKKVNGKEYFYLKYRKGNKVIYEYLGKEFPSKLAKQIERRKRLERELKEIKDAIKFLTHKRIKEVELIEPLENFFKIMTEEKLWEEGIEVIGAWCFGLYQKFLPIRKFPLRTQDLDILIPYPYHGKAFDISNYLKQLGFEEHINPDQSVFYTGYGLKIEFLAPRRGRGVDKSPYIRKLGISPQTLRFTSILFDEGILLSISKGIKVRVPSPTTFLVHKLLVSEKRKDKGKKEKDIRQAIYTAEYVLKFERDKLVTLLSKIPSRWRKRIKRVLEGAIDLLPQEESIIFSLLTLLGDLPPKS